MNRCLSLLLATAAGLLLGSCGGSSGPQVAEGGIGGTGISTGRVTQVGSVYVNGIHYNTDNASFVIEGATMSSQVGLPNINTGMVVRVTGSKDEATASGTANEVRYDNVLIGPIDSGFTLGSLGVMGQTVRSNSDTVFQGDATHTLLSDLQVGDTVAVSGFSDGATGILATWIELKSAPPTQYKVTGVATAVNSVANSFQIGGLNVDASAIPSSLPVEGTYVEVTGDTAPTGNNFTAQQIDILGNGDGTVGGDGDEIEVEGQITTGLGGAPLNTDQFSLNGQIVQVDSGTLYVNGGPSDLAIDRIVEAEGVMSGTVLLADRIEVSPAETSKEEMGGNVTAVDEIGSTITLLGQIVKINNSTILASDLGGQSTFTLAQLATAVNDSDPSNDYVEVRFYIDIGNDPVATKVEREPLPGADYGELEGIVTSHNAGATEFTTAGVLVNYSNYSGPYTPADGDRVDVRGTFINGVLEATYVGLSN